MQDIIEMNHIVKIFPPSLIALDDVSVTFRKGEIHAIVGENGAGKSTLMKILYGMQPADSGEIIFNGKPVKFNDPGEAILAGIGMVHQEIMLVPQYTVWENVVLGSEPVKLIDHLDSKKARQLVKEKIEEFNFNLNPDAKVEDISIAARQKVEILKLLFRNVSVLIMDEPTSVLTPAGNSAIIRRTKTPARQWTNHFIYFAPPGRSAGTHRPHHRVAQRAQSRHHRDQRCHQGRSGADDGRTGSHF